MDIQGCYQYEGYIEKIILGSYSKVKYSTCKDTFDLYIENTLEDKIICCWYDKKYSDIKMIEISDEDYLNEGELYVEITINTEFDRYQSFWLRVVDIEEPEHYDIITNQELFDKYKMYVLA
jgi:hypothetical protein